jgi:hypothetical protein
MSEYHPYTDGYSVLPKLNKFSGENVFCIDGEYDDYIRQKQEALNLQGCVFEYDIDDRTYEAVCSYLVDQVEKEFPGHLQGPVSFSALAMQLQEDLVIHRLEPDRDWMAACHLCFPSGWLPEEKIGKPLREIHRPIPGMKLDASRKLVETMVNHGPFFRFVWSPIFEDRINFHPRYSKKEYEPGDPIFVKVERQVTIPLPEVNASLFILRQHIIRNVRQKELAKAILGMNDEQKAYKVINKALFRWAERRASEGYDS